TMEIEKRVNPGIDSIKPYEPGKSVFEADLEQRGVDFIKMASNENPLGVSPKALAAIKENAHLCYAYPEVSCARLRTALAKEFDLPPDMFIVGNGADGIIYALGLALVNQDDEAVIPGITFPYYEIVVRAMRGRVVQSAMRGFAIDLDDILARLTPKTKLIWISNPNNPTGCLIPRDEFARFYEQVPDNVFVVHDEVYADFAPPEQMPDTRALLKQGRANLVLMRSFSKIYGLAGIRLGFGMADPELIKILYKVRPPFDVSVLAEIAGCAALCDREFYAETLNVNTRGKAYLYGELQALGLDYIPSATNFIVLDTKRDCRVVARQLQQKGIIIRPADTYGMPTCIRVTIGSEKQNRRFVDALKQVLG
ncbi:MAG: histidinol-phosphate transaminase, partial [Spirochaetia bacterium]